MTVADDLSPAENETSEDRLFALLVDKRTREDDTPSAWMIRGGRHGQFEKQAIEENIACIGWSARQIPNLTSISSRDELAGLVEKALPEGSGGKVRAWVGQLWRLTTEIRRGDLIAMPMKTTSQIALGVVSQEYWYRENIESDVPPHVLSVDWIRTDMPRSALKDDLLASLGSQLTICAIRAKDAAWRLQHLIENGSDPGPREAYGVTYPLDLSTLIKRFRDETGYPTEAHEEQMRHREQWAEKLATKNIANLSRHDLTAVASHGNWVTGKYIYPQATGVMQWIQDLTDEEYSRMLDHIRYLCWGKDELWQPIRPTYKPRWPPKDEGDGRNDYQQVGRHLPP